MTTSSLRAEVHAIVDQLSESELRVWRFNGRRNIDIGHAKYGPLDLYIDKRDWLVEYAEELSDGEQFYRPLAIIALADRRLELERAVKAAESNKHAAQEPRVTATFETQDTGAEMLAVEEILL